jgi:hypothetical protein
VVLRFRWRDLRDVARAQIELLAAQFLLWRRPIGKLVECNAAGTATPLTSTARAEAEAVGRAITRAARLGVFRPRCLVRALALHRSLERRGIHGSTVRIGVRQNKDALLAHAWVEYDGEVFGDNAAMVAQFAVLTEARFPEVSSGGLSR